MDVINAHLTGFALNWLEIVLKWFEFLCNVDRPKCGMERREEIEVGKRR